MNKGSCQSACGLQVDSVLLQLQRGRRGAESLRVVDVGKQHQAQSEESRAVLVRRNQGLQVREEQLQQSVRSLHSSKPSPILPVMLRSSDETQTVHGFLPEA